MFCVYLSTPSRPPSFLCSNRPMWRRAPLWRLISAIRRSLLKPRGMFQTPADAMHLGVAPPPELLTWKSSAQPTLAQVLRNCYTAESHIYQDVCPHLLSVSLFLWTLSDFSGDVSHFVSTLRQRKGHTVLLSLAQRAVCLLKGQNRTWFSPTSPVGLFERTVSTRANR